MQIFSKSVAVAAILLLCRCALAEDERRPAGDQVLVGATVYPAPAAPPVIDAIVVIHGGRIAAVGPKASTKIPPNARILDCSGKFITAGFWNNHVHLFTPALLHAEISSAGELNNALDEMLNRWGFTTVFDLASVLENTLALRRRIDAREVRGPHILTVGEPVWTAVPIYVRSYLEQNHIAMPVVGTTDEAARRVSSQIARGVDGIKLFTGSVQGHGVVVNMPVEMVRVAVQEAHQHGLPVFVHPQNSEGLEVALEGGVDVLAHTAPNSPDWTAAFVSRLTAAHIALIPTLTLFDYEAHKDGSSDEERDHWLSKMIQELHAFSAGGGEVLFGTDVGYTDHFDTTMEFDLMSKSGLSWQQILASLTVNPAARFHAAARSGRVANGFDADLVVLDFDPATDPKNLAAVRYTIRGGQVVYAAH